MNTDMKIRNINGVETRPTVFSESASVELTEEPTLANTTAVDMDEKGVGPTNHSLLYPTATSVDVDRMMAILREQVDNDRLDLRHCNLAYAMTMLVNNGAAASADIQTIIDANNKIVELEDSLVEKESEYDGIVQRIQYEIKELDKDIADEKDPDRLKQLRAQRDAKIAELDKAGRDWTDYKETTQANIAAYQKTVGDTFSHLDETQQKSFVVAMATISAMAKKGALSSTAVEAERAKATLDGAESLALHLDKSSPGIKQAYESALQLAEYAQNKNIPYV